MRVKKIFEVEYENNTIMESRTIEDALWSLLHSGQPFIVKEIEHYPAFDAIFDNFDRQKAWLIYLVNREKDREEEEKK